jgi:hypothetical protein
MLQILLVNYLIIIQTLKYPSTLIIYLYDFRATMPLLVIFSSICYDYNTVELDFSLRFFMKIVTPQEIKFML